MTEANDRLSELLHSHPKTCPDWPLPLPYLLEVPSIFASDFKLRRFQWRTLLPLIRARPTDRFYRAVDAAINEALAWRATIPEHERFWQKDPEKRRPHSQVFGAEFLH